MVFLLFVVSLLLALGGGAAALYGADTIRTETGSTLAVAGVAMTCAGLLMFALTACLSELKKIRRLVEAGDAVAPATQAPFPVAVPAVVAPATAAAVAAAVVAADRTPPETGAPAVRPVEPERDALLTPLKPEPAGKKEAADAAPEEPPALRSTLLPDAEEEKLSAGIWDPERPAHVPAGGVASEVETVGHDTAPASDTPPSVDEAAQEREDAAARDDADGPSTDGSEPAPAKAPEERELVATYTSGENTYFMYSDNAIEAETPHGRFRFASMEELRVFVETGAGGMPLTPPPPRRPD